MNLLGKNIDSTPCKVFGRRAFKHSGPKGSVFYVDIKKDIINPQLRSQLSIYTKGRVIVSTTNKIVPEYILEKGATDLERTPIAAIYKCDVMEDMEFWCIDNNATTIAKETVRPLKLLSGDSFNVLFSEGHKVFLCSGELTVDSQNLSGPIELTSATNKTLIANTECYGFIFMPK